VDNDFLFFSKINVFQRGGVFWVKNMEGENRLGGVTIYVILMKQKVVFSFFRVIQ
jgi:hypothetical protein